MENWEVWNKILERGSAEISSLSPNERTVYRVNCFLCEIEGGGLSGFLYNVSPTFDLHHWSELRETSDAVEAVGHPGCAGLLRDLGGLLESLPTQPASTWAEFLDPVAEHLKTKVNPAIESCINDLWAMLRDFTKHHLVSGD